jgi:DNA polymerase I-like protein with 3'-5' exonuclease and polymerase domains
VDKSRIVIVDKQLILLYARRMEIEEIEESEIELQAPPAAPPVAPQDILVSSQMNPPLNAVLVTDQAGLDEVEKFLETAEIFGLDLETNVTDTFADRYIRTAQLGNKEIQYVIDLLAFVDSYEDLVACQGQYGALSQVVLAPVIKVLRKAIESKSIIKVGQGLQFEYEMLRWNLGLRATGFYCCLLAEKSIYAGLVHFMQSGFWAMENLVKRYTGLNMAVNELGKSFGGREPLTWEQIEYCALDVRLPLAVRMGQLRLLEADGLLPSALIEFDAISPFGDMHLNGVLLAEGPWRDIINDVLHKKALVVEALDRVLIPIVGRKGVTDDDRARALDIEKKWRDCASKTPEEKRIRASFRKEYMALRKHITERRKDGSKCTGQAFLNYSSPKQLTAAMLKLGYKKTDIPNTADDTLKKLAKFPNMTLKIAFETCQELTSNASGVLLKLPLCDLLRLYRSLEKSLTTYGETWILTQNKKDAEGNYGLVNPATGRIHSNISQFGAATGRTSSSNPNIQNIPKGSAYRHSFVARPGYKLLTIDYNGCELRILAVSAKEQKWLDAFAKGWDVHSVGAEILYGQKWKDGAEPGCKYYSEHQKCKCVVHVELRGYVKAVNFGIAYGKGAAALAEELGISKEAGYTLLDLYKRSFPTVTKYLETAGRDAKALLMTRTMSGRRRRWLKPTWDRAKALVEKDLNKKKAKKGQPPLPWKNATSAQISKRLKGMFASIEREGKNCPIQGTNADLAKIAMYLIWLGLETFGAFFYNMVHDELVIECPDENVEACYEFVSTCMTAAGVNLIPGIVMETEGKKSQRWEK